MRHRLEYCRSTRLDQAINPAEQLSNDHLSSTPHSPPKPAPCQTGEGVPHCRSTAGSRSPWPPVGEHGSRPLPVRPDTASIDFPAQVWLRPTGDNSIADISPTVLESGTAGSHRSVRPGSADGGRVQLAAGCRRAGRSLRTSYRRWYHRSRQRDHPLRPARAGPSLPHHHAGTTTPATPARPLPPPATTYPQPTNQRCCVDSLNLSAALQGRWRVHDGTRPGIAERRSSRSRSG